jgi:hypothetical protein
MIDERSRKRLPPYVSYRTFRAFLSDLQQVIPSRIDNSYWGTNYSGSTKTQLMSAIIFLNLIDSNGVPTNRLKLVVGVKDVKQTDILKETCTDAYQFIFKGTFDTQTGTYAQLQEMFHSNFQISSSVIRKCIKFFVDMTADAGIALSPYIIKQTRNSHSGTAAKTAAKKVPPRIGRNLPSPTDQDENSSGIAWDKMLLNKFPAFDPTWPAEVQLQWFKAFDELLKRGLTKPGL